MSFDGRRKREVIFAENLVDGRLRFPFPTRSTAEKLGTKSGEEYLRQNVLIIA